MLNGRRLRRGSAAMLVGGFVCGAMVCTSSADASTDTLSGTVVDASGQTVAGAQVQLNAFATDKDGVHEVAIASTTSDTSGQYVFSTPSASQTASLTGIEDGTFNYEVDVTYTSGGATQSATTTLPASAAFSASAAARNAANLPTSGRIKLTLAPLRTAGGSLVKAGTIRPNLDCTNNYPTWKTVSTGTYNVIIGEPHAYIDMAVQYKYDQNATTTVGVALTANGGGAWSASGTVSDTYSGGSSMLTAWSPIHYAPYVYGQFLYAKQQEYFNCTGASDTYRVLATSWTGGATISGNLTEYDGGSSPIWKYDMSVGSGNIHIPLGVTWTKTGGNGNTYGGGTSFAGINLSTNTTYSSAVTYSWKMGTNSGVGHDLFGAGGVYPAQSSGATVVYAN
jgi:hypothetical protein